MVKVFFSKHGQVKVTIPKALATALQFKHGQTVIFLIDNDELIIKKVEKK